MLLKMNENGFPETTSEERLMVKIWIGGMNKPTWHNRNPFKRIAETYHTLSETAHDEKTKNDLITLRNIATYRAANP